MIAPMSVVITTQLPRRRGNAIPLGSKEKSAITTVTKLLEKQALSKSVVGVVITSKSRMALVNPLPRGRGNGVVSVVMAIGTGHRIRGPGARAPTVPTR